MGLFDMIGNLGATATTNAMQYGLQKETWKREDNATQRRAADLKAAGLSPVLAAGQAASSSAPMVFKTPEFNNTLGSAASNWKAFQEAKASSKLQQLAIDNAVANKELTNMTTAQRAAETVKTETETATNRHNLGWYQGWKQPTNKTGGLGMDIMTILEGLTALPNKGKPWFDAAGGLFDGITINPKPKEQKVTVPGWFGMPVKKKLSDLKSYGTGLPPSSSRRGTQQ